MNKIILSGEPKSTSHIYKMTCKGNFAVMYMSKEGKDIKEKYGWEAKTQWKEKPLKGDVWIEVDLYFGTKRNADIDNFNKLLYDAMTGIIWEDDSQVMKVTTTKHYDKKNPRIEIIIK